MNYCLIGVTMLIWAAWYGRTGTVEALLRAGADVNHQNREGKYYIFFHLYYVCMILVK